MQTHKICGRCKTSKEVHKFSRHLTRKDGLRACCKICENESNRVRYKKFGKKKQKRNIERTNSIKLNMFNFLSSHPCVDCNESDPLVLEFDHFRDKSCNVSKLVTKNNAWKRIVQELEKCHVRCANCHRRKTHIEQNSYRYKFSLLQKKLV